MRIGNSTQITSEAMQNMSMMSMCSTTMCGAFTCDVIMCAMMCKDKMYCPMCPDI